MEIVQEFSNQFMLYIPALVIVGAILVFTFGFKSVEQPPFRNLTTEDRKSAGKKRKLKEKKSTANGHVPVSDSKSEKSPKKSPTKEVVEAKQEKKEKKLENKQSEKPKKTEVKAKNNVDELKNKKNLKKTVTEKPVDFDDGDWETVPAKADKKKKGEQSPVKKEKKSKKNEKVDKTEVEKLVKEIANKELQEIENEKAIDNETVAETEPQIEEIAPTEEPAVVVEVKKEKKKKEKKPKKEANEKTSPPEDKPQAVSSPVEPKQVEVAVEVEKLEDVTSKPKEAAVAFDELGDTWTDAKVAKKSKKKARRDN